MAASARSARRWRGRWTRRTSRPSRRSAARTSASNRADLRRQIQEALAELPHALREAVVKRDLQEFSYQEIADQLGLPEGTVKSRINRGRLRAGAAAPLAVGEGPRRGHDFAWEIRMNVTTSNIDGVVVVKVGETRLTYPILSDFATTVTTLVATARRRSSSISPAWGQVRGQRDDWLPHGPLPAGHRGGQLAEAARVQKRVETMLAMTGAHNFLEVHADQGVRPRELTMRRSRPRPGRRSSSTDALNVIETSCVCRAQRADQLRGRRLANPAPRRPDDRRTTSVPT
ncbi:MAG: sigma factor-like helix-turn-helix DNA-binding protein [Vicinamibacterales bacterium]